MSAGLLGFRSGVVKPIECLNGGWALIKGRYWLTLGVVFVGTLIAQLAPFGILLGPMFVGIYLFLSRLESRETATFDVLFKGFDRFVDGLVAALCMLVPMLVIILTGYIAMTLVMFATLPAAPKPGAAPGPAPTPWAFLASMAGFWFLIIVLQLALSVLFFFPFQLIADRRMKGLDAVKLGIRASKANFGGVLLLVLLTMFVSMLGSLACCVGSILVMPIHFAANWYAYRQVFPRDLVVPESVDGNTLDYMDP